MVIEVANHQRDVDVATLANGFAVVHGLENREAAGMLLHRPRQRVEIASSRMRSERLPLWQGCSGGTHRCIDIGGRPLGYVG